MRFSCASIATTASSHGKRRKSTLQSLQVNSKARGIACLIEGCLHIRQRFVVAGMACLGLTAVHFQRCCIYVVLATLVKRLHIEECPLVWSDGKTNEVDFIHDWSNVTQGHILASFFLGYMITQIPGGVLSVIYGVKYTVSGSIFLSSVCSILTPLAARTNIWFLVAVRFTMGLSQGPLDAALSTTGVKWSPIEERCFLKGIVYTGVPLGLFLSNIVTVCMVHIHGDAYLVFYIAGLLGIIWCCIWQIVFFNSPPLNPFITFEELMYILRSVAFDCKMRGRTQRFSYTDATGILMDINSIQWRAIFKSRQIQILWLANFGYEFGFQLLAMKLPIYVSTVFQLPTLKMGVVSSAPWVCMTFGTLMFSSFGQLLAVQRIFKSEALRKSMGLISCVLCGLCLEVAAQTQCAVLLDALLFSLAGLYAGAAPAGLWLSPSLLAPAVSGPATAAANLLAPVPGVLIPLFRDAVFSTHEGTKEDWKLLFSLSAAVMMIFPLPYILFCDTKIQWWNQSRKL